MMMSDNNNIASHLSIMAKEHPDLLAVAVQKYFIGLAQYSELTFKELNDECDRIAFGLTSIGISKGVRTVLMVKPSIEFFALTFALFKVKAIPVMVDPGIGLDNLKKCLDEARPEAFIGIPKAHIGRILYKWAEDHIKILVTVGKKLFWRGVTLKGIRSRCDEPFEALPPEPDETAAILFTSGSTGVPKGVVYTHENFNAQVDILRDEYGIKPGERDLSTFPLFALFGPALGMASIAPDMDASKPAMSNPRNIVQAIRDYNATNMFASPALIEVVGNHGKKMKEYKAPMKLDSLKRVISAGAPAEAGSLRTFIDIFAPGVEVLTSYGATESLPVSFIGTNHLLTKTEDATINGDGVCVGKPVKDAEVSIININDEPIDCFTSGLKTKPGQIGEIVVKGPMVTKGYFRNEKADQLAKIPALDNNDFYHRMGDVGYLDAIGRLWMCGRKSHRVEAFGETFYTIPCERIFNVHPKVRRTALVKYADNGVAYPVLCIELHKKARAKEKVIIQRELRAIGAENPITKDIRLFVFYPKFPVDIRHNAKIFREKLADWTEKMFEKGVSN